MTKFYGTSGVDSFGGTDGNDIFVLWQGGDDDIDGLDGRDDFRMRDQYSSADTLDGGDGIDKLSLNGDYALTLTGASLTSIERLRLVGPHDYNISFDNSLLGPGQFFVNAPLDAEHSLTFDGSGEFDSSFLVYAGAGDDNLFGSSHSDKFYLGKGGTDIALGWFGNDRINMDGALTAADHIDGGEGFDTVYLNGDYAGANGVVFTDTTMVAVEVLKLERGHSYDLTFADGTVDSFHNLTLFVDAHKLLAGDYAHIDGSAELDSNYTMLGGKGDDSFIGGLFADSLDGKGGDDTLTGGGGLDTLTGGLGADTFRYTATSESHSTAHDQVFDFNAGSDFIDTPIAVTSLGTPPIGPKTVNFATFDSDMGTAISDALLGHQAIVLDVTAGDYAGHTFVVVDANASQSYDTNDYLIDITGYTGTIAAANFI